MIPELLLKFMLCSAIFFGAYKLLLEKDEYHYFKRYYLLSSLVFAAIIPFITISITADGITELPNPVYYIYDQFIPAPANNDLTESVKPETGQLNYLLVIYLIVSCTLLFRFIKNLSSLIWLAKINERTTYKGIIYILVKDSVTPFSFLNYIFVSKEEFINNHIEKEILQHEATHITQRHTWDNIFIEFLTCFLWINPVILLYRKAIKLNHEFLADHAVVKQNNDAPSYLKLLITKTLSHSSNQLTSSFNFLTIKKRMIMLSTKKSTTTSIMHRVLLIPVTCFAIYLFSNKVIAQQTTSNKSKQTTTSESQKIKPSVIRKDGPGATEKEIEEYNTLIQRAKKDNSIRYNINEFTVDERKRMREIFNKMTKEQKNQLDVWIMAPGVLGPSTPTEKQFEAFKNSNVYGVWINEKKVPNTELNKYKAEDFGNFFISKLYGAAKKGRSYTHQLDMMTKDHYDNYRKMTIESNKKNENIYIIPNRNKVKP